MGARGLLTPRLTRERRRCTEASERASSLVADYDLGPFFDEMFEAAGRPRHHYRALNDRLGALSDDGLRERIRTANAFF